MIKVDTRLGEYVGRVLAFVVIPAKAGIQRLAFSLFCPLKIETHRVPGLSQGGRASAMAENIQRESRPR